MQSRSNNLVIHGLPETSYAEAALTAEDAGGVVLRLPGQDTIHAILECCKSRMKLDVTSNDIVNCYRISGSKGSRPIVVTFSGKGVRDKVYAAKKHYVEQAATHRSTSTNISQRETQIFAKGRKPFKEKKIASIWTCNGSVFLKRTESSRPVRIQDLEGLEMLI